MSYIDNKGCLHQGVTLEAVESLDFVGFWPVRRPVSYQGQPNYPGYYWFSQLKNLVPYESRLEMFTLLDIDFSACVRGILTQPLLFQFNNAGTTYKHIPDLLVTHTNGNIELIDVKPKKYLNTEQN